MLKTIRLSLLTGASMLIVVPAHALMIDDFSSGQDLLSVNGTGSTTGSETGNGIIGGQRDSMLSVAASPYHLLVNLDIADQGSTNGAFYSSDVGDVGMAQFDYSGLHIQGNGGPGLAADVSGDGGFQVTFLQTDSPVRVDFTATTFGTGGGSDKTSVGYFMTNAMIGSPSTYTLNFNDMTVGNGSSGQFDPTMLDRLTVKFTPQNPGADFAIGSINTSPVPEPAGLLSLAFGVLGLVGMRRRRTA